MQLCLQMELAKKITITSLTEVTLVCTTNGPHVRKKKVTLNVIFKTFV